MASPRQPKKANLNREPKRIQNQPGPPPQKDAYARLLSQHRSTKFSLYLEQYAKDLSYEREENRTNPSLRAQSDRLNIPQQNRESLLNDFSDSSDFSPSSLKSKGEESSLSLYMEKLSSCNVQQDSERKQGVSDRQRRGQRRDTATSHDGDIESGEELGSLKPDDAKKHQKQQRRNKESNRDVASRETDALVGHPQSPKKSETTGQEQEKMKKSKKKIQSKQLDERKNTEGKSADDAQTTRPKSPHVREKKVQQSQGKQLFLVSLLFLK